MPDVENSFDAVVVGAGIAGLYAVHKLRARGMRVRGFESAAGVGGTWYHNRYPGARCDVESIDYSYSFDEELQQEWTWSERFAAQDEILRYLGHVANRHDLRSAYEFSTRVTAADYDDRSGRWTVRTDTARTVSARFLVLATGVLSATNMPEIPGRDSFAGELYHTGAWPHHGVEFEGKRVGVIGTGSSGIQTIPVVAETAARVTVFQRSPNYSIPARNRPLPPEFIADVKAGYPERRRLSRISGGGTPNSPHPRGALEVDAAERTRIYDQWWERGGYLFAKAFPDQTTNLAANDTAREYVEAKIRELVHDPEIAEQLIPDDHPIGTKRIVTDSGYFEAYNRENVELVNLRRTPITEITPSGVRTSDGLRELDMLIFATGFDAMTGSLSRIDLRGRDGRTLRDAWSAGPRTYLGLAVSGFPNMFVVSGPGSPSVLANMVLTAEQHVDWIASCLDYLDEHRATTIEASEDAVTEWVATCNANAAATLFPAANSWYLGANIPGKPRVFMPYVGGLGKYRAICDDVASDGYRGFVLDDRAAEVKAMLAGLADFPDVTQHDPAGLRTLIRSRRAPLTHQPAMRIAEDRVIPGPGGDLRLRIYAPHHEGPLPVVVFAHGGGFVFCDLDSHDEFCRSLADAVEAVVIAVDYRLAPEHPGPAAMEDVYAAVVWAAEHAAEYGGDPARIGVVGDSAGGNLAATVCLAARDRGGPRIAAQVLLYPVIDDDFSTESYQRYGEGYYNTETAMRWYWAQYAPNGTDSPYLVPTRAESLVDLPPAVVATAELDPLCTAGDDYAERLREAGVSVTAHRFEGLFHGFLTIPALSLTEPAREKLWQMMRDLLA
ncbi:alpha/beta hydrolase fold domain-containing protein [Amycolatopsis halotolerans]|uniref:Alpha/beta hydrolase fold domain-containing protein n=1 Tax=Amycolatopsis halotolerans TaxID=330083 RepID=A0ABV7Q8L5_9PSEU